ncbi:MAG: hypothetical protein Q4C98_05555 [Capnocytophaga sp.]|nr:hypothetical protein [Capnocytophaga sp.]
MNIPKIPLYQSPEDYQGEKKIIIKPTTEKQKRLWKETLPELKSIEDLSCFFAIKEDLFDVICGLEHLKQLYFQTRMTSIEGIEKLKNLTGFHISNAPKLESIEPIGKMIWLKELTIELPKITDYSALATLVNLEELHLDGGIDRYQKLDNILFVKNMKKLKILTLTSTRMTDKNFDALTHLVSLEELRISWNYPTEEFEKLRVLPNLKICDPLFYEN